MKKRSGNLGFIFRATIGLVLLFAAGCAEIRLNSLPTPSPTAKLRVFVLPVSGSLSRGSWPVPHPEFAHIWYDKIGRSLSEKGIYEVVSQGDVEKVMAGQEPAGWGWEKDGWQLAKTAGRALHADYVWVLMRGESSGFHFVKMVLINLATGSQYEKLDYGKNLHNPRMRMEEYRRTFHECYQEIFRQAKGDMLATALRKGRVTPRTSERPAGEVPRLEPEARPAAPEALPPEPPGAVAVDRAPQRPAGMAAETARRSADVKSERSGPAAGKGAPQARPAAPEAKRAAGAGEEGQPSARQRMIVYDLQTTAQLNVAGLILSEALREELFALGGFDLINREDMGQAIQEMKLQQSGLIDDQQALQIGKWMAANQTITGNLGIIGDALMLQTKRTDLQTMVVLSRGSARAGVGQEEELLNALPALVRKLISR